MPALETLKKIAEWPSPNHLGRLVRPRKPHTFRFKDDGIIPNHPRWPLILYRSVARLEEGLDPAAVFEDSSQQRLG